MKLPPWQPSYSYFARGLLPSYTVDDYIGMLSALFTKVSIWDIIEVGTLFCAFTSCSSSPHCGFLCGPCFEVALHKSSPLLLNALGGSNKPRFIEQWQQRPPACSFSFFIAQLNTYNRLYGSLGTLMLLLVWVNANSAVLLVGFELDASVEKARRQAQEKFSGSAT